MQLYHLKNNPTSNGASPANRGIILPPNFSKNLAGGFTFIELIIVIAIIGIIATYGIIAGIDSYRKQNLRSQVDEAIFALEKARSEAINNISGADHGVYLANPTALILFRGNTYGAQPAYNLPLEKNPALSFSNTCTNNEVVFSKVSGETGNCNLKISNSQKTFTITINNAGGIDY
ncbi:prepilin-type N-terminal cleavage/methylation domain-containing protein [Candidatus Giovannonibacteria bacterium]|nr:prepilin-type N-terminal cleavage/methylation domain-containing protein [Candidatus Giovannonibacteria bacterium]